MSKADFYCSSYVKVRLTIKIGFFLASHPILEVLFCNTLKRLFLELHPNLEVLFFKKLEKWFFELFRLQRLSGSQWRAGIQKWVFFLGVEKPLISQSKINQKSYPQFFLAKSLTRKMESVYCR